MDSKKSNGLQMIEDDFKVHELDTIAEELYGGNNCTCTHHNSVAGCGHSPTTI